MNAQPAHAIHRDDSEATRAVRAVIVAGSMAASRGWVPATSGNFSARIDARRVAITATGTDKGALGETDVLVVDVDGLQHPRASAEAALHFALYRSLPEIGAVLHVHSLNATLASLHLAESRRIVFKGLELLKALHGVRTHETRVEVPVYANSQNIAALAETVMADLARERGTHGFLLKGHGIYVWGRSEAEAWRHLEAFDYLFALQLELRRLKR
jgi:methylthioribulose-1-phosphate dehydratase